MKKEIVPCKKTYKELKKYYPKGKVKGFQALVLYYMYILGIVKRGKAPEDVARVCKEDLIRFDEFTNTFEFLKSRNLDSYEDIAKYKAQCEEKIQFLRNEKKGYQEKHEERNKLYGALVDYKMYQKAYLLYQQGYTSMERDRHKYLDAKETLGYEGYTNIRQFKILENEYSEYLEASFKFNNNIRHYKNMSKRCDKVIANCDAISINLLKYMDYLNNFESMDNPQIVIFDK